MHVISPYSLQNHKSLKSCLELSYQYALSSKQKHHFWEFCSLTSLPVPRISSAVPQSSCSHTHQQPHTSVCGTMPLSSLYRMPFFQGACLLARWAAGPFLAKTKWLWVCWRPPSGQRKSDQNTKHHLQCTSWLTLSKCSICLVSFLFLAGLKWRHTREQKGI